MPFRFGVGEVDLTRAKEDKNFKSLPVVGGSSLVRPGAFAFCDRESGTVRFRVPASATGTLPIEQAASLLAMHCLVRGQTPHDYTVLVVPEGALLDPVGRRAGELLEAGRAIRSGIALTSREHEVLGWVLQNLSNKQIASRLNLAERTIKFHVSALLAKFKVSNRFGLIRHPMVGLQPEGSLPTDPPIELPAPPPTAQPKETKLRRASPTCEIRMLSSVGNA